MQVAMMTFYYHFSTQTIAHRGHRAVSDSALLLQHSQFDDGNQSYHRDRSSHTIETKIISNSRLAVSCIGKGSQF